MATNAREARRRKIVDRGTDRLALITGRIQTFPSSSSQDEDTTGSDPLSQPFFSHDQDLQPNVSVLPKVSPHGEDEVADSLLLKHDHITNAGQTNAYSDGRKCEISAEALRGPASEVNDNIQSPLVASINQNSPVPTFGREQRLEQHTQQRRFFTPKQIRSAITESERTRLSCSVTIALLVVLSYLGFPLLGSYIINSILSFRPLYLVLLTNLTVVLARLLFYKQRGLERVARDENITPSLDGYDWAEQVGKTLETGFLMQKALDAVFMDCSVYAIIVVCGISLAQLFSW